MDLWPFITTSISNIPKMQKGRGAFLHFSLTNCNIMLVSYIHQNVSNGVPYDAVLLTQ